MFFAAHVDEVTKGGLKIPLLSEPTGVISISLMMMMIIIIIILIIIFGPFGGSFWVLLEH